MSFIVLQQDRTSSLDGLELILKIAQLTKGKRLQARPIQLVYQIFKHTVLFAIIKRVSIQFKLK